MLKHRSLFATGLVISCIAIQNINSRPVEIKNNTCHPIHVTLEMSNNKLGQSIPSDELILNPNELGIGHVQYPGLPAIRDTKLTISVFWHKPATKGKPPLNYNIGTYYNLNLYNTDEESPRILKKLHIQYSPEGSLFLHIQVEGEKEIVIRLRPSSLNA